MSPAPPQVALRPESDADQALSRAIYGASRADELARVPWSTAQREAFLDQQFDAQRRHYRAQHPRAEWSIVVVDGEDAGRIYVDEVPGMLLLMDLALLPAFRGRGVARVLLARVLDRADGGHLAVRLHVEKDNPVQHWYRRLGFAIDGDAGVYWRMVRPARGAVATGAAA